MVLSLSRMKTPPDPETHEKTKVPGEIPEPQKGNDEKLEEMCDDSRDDAWKRGNLWKIAAVVKVS
ncbi:hypothetical protein DAEQUDRAFT_769626 [Daedalea quercina L-15889]|uniref:Uncharacterized protein n=1 Tax=Daedalea quercina L-15889 TaxID=1314783 RepID=A0A165LJM6_9APHY|nr:hypothetical protein DAEQUDRAFT_769626 [Daedalea quercina L-15889]